MITFGLAGAAFKVEAASGSVRRKVRRVCIMVASIAIIRRRSAWPHKKMRPVKAARRAASVRKNETGLEDQPQRDIDLTAQRIESVTNTGNGAELAGVQIGSRVGEVWRIGQV